MKSIVGTLAYLAAITIVILASLFDDVAWPITTVAVIMLVVGALWAWTDSPTAPPDGDTKRATADDVR